MIAVYKRSTGKIIGVTEDDHTFSDNENANFDSGTWGTITVPEAILTGVKSGHYQITSGNFELLPESDWPENLNPSKPLES